MLDSLAFSCVFYALVARCSGGFWTQLGLHPDTAINSRLALAHLYTSWGFLEEARLKYAELISDIEGDTQDEVLYNALGRGHLQQQFEELLVAELLQAQDDLRDQVQQGFVNGSTALTQLSALENIDVDLSPGGAARVWDGLSTICDSLLEVFGRSVAYRTKVTELKARYSANAVRDAFFAEGIANPWTSREEDPNKSDAAGASEKSVPN